MVESIEEQIKKMCKSNLVLAKAIENVLRCCVSSHRNEINELKERITRLEKKRKPKEAKKKNQVSKK